MERLFRVLLAATLASALVGCASPRRRPPIARPAPPPGGIGIDLPGVAATALSFVGVPYRTGGADPAGFDCSGLVQYVFAQHGYALPRLAREQFAFGRRVRGDAVAAGDLVFFATAGPDISHVGIAIDGVRFVHAPAARGAVRVESLGSAYWRTRYAGARRITGDQAAR